MSNIATIMKECRTSMEKGVEAAKREFSTVRSGKASPNMLDQVKDGLDIARLATIPHGDAVLALGRSERLDGAPKIPAGRLAIKERWRNRMRGSCRARSP